MKNSFFIYTVCCLTTSLFLMFTGIVNAQEFKVNSREFSYKRTGKEINDFCAAVPSSSTSSLPFTGPILGPNFDILSCQADFYDAPASTLSNFTVKEIKSFLKLSIDHNYNSGTPSSIELMEAPYVYRIVLEVNGYTSLGSTTPSSSFLDTLTISYLPDSTLAYQDIHMKTYYGFYKIQAKILNIYDITEYSNTQILANAPTAGTISSTSNCQATVTQTITGLSLLDGLLYSSKCSCLKSNWILEAGITYQKFDLVIPTGAPHNVYNATMSGIVLVPSHTPPSSASNTLKINWEFVPSSNEVPNIANYELEWIYVDNYDVDFTNSGQMTINEKGPSNVNFDFRENATRIITDKPFYEIPLIYKNGYIVYRVRLLRSDNSQYKNTKYSDWSMSVEHGPISNLLGLSANCFYKIDEAHMQDEMNWNFQHSFAEEGKNKAVMSYFDGLLKNRQSITRFNSRPNQLIVTEPFYNYEGAVGLQTLPVPVVMDPADNKFQFQYEFTNYNGTGPIRAEIFDNKSSVINDANLLSALSPSTSKATKYYSTSNSLLGSNDLSIKAIPNAKGFPFILTKYTPDDNSRVKIQGGAGEELQIGKGHETRFFYSDPDQYELTKYLGQHAGLYRFYEKTITKDPNGQLSFSISNNLGKPIMTGLMGTPPDAVDPLKPILPLDGLNGVYPGATPMNTTDLLFGKDKMKFWNGNKFVHTKTYLNEMTSDNIYGFSLSLPGFTPKCDNFLAPTPPVYLNVPITCEIKVTPETSSPTIIGPYIISPTDANFVSSSSASINLNQGLTNTSITAMPFGEVSVNYELAFNEEDVDRAINNLLTPSTGTSPLPAGCIKTRDDFLIDQLEKIPDACEFESEELQSTCSHMEDLMKKQLFPENVYGKYHKYGKNSITIVGDQRSLFGIVGWINTLSPITPPAQPCDINLPKNYEIPALILNANPTNGLPAFPTIVTPYPDQITDATLEDLDSYFDIVASLGYRPIYRYQELVGSNNEVISKLNTLAASGIIVNYSTTATELIDIFNDDIATAMLPLHPEYCEHRARYCDAQIGSEFLNQLANIPDNITAVNLGMSSVEDLISKDPFYSQWLSYIKSNPVTYTPFALMAEAKLMLSLTNYINPHGSSYPNSNLIPIRRYAYIKTKVKGTANTTDANDAILLNDWTENLNTGTLAFYEQFEYVIDETTLSLAIDNLSVSEKDIYFQELRTLYTARREFLTEIIRDNSTNWLVPSNSLVQCSEVLGLIDLENKVYEDFITGANTGISTNSSMGTSTDPEIASFLSSVSNSSTVPIEVDDAIQINTLFSNYALYITNQLRNCMSSPTTIVQQTILDLIQFQLYSTMQDNRTNGRDKVWKGGITPEIVKQIILDKGLILDDLCNPFLIDYQKSEKSVMNYSICDDKQFFIDMSTALEVSPVDIMRINTSTASTIPVSGSYNLATASTTNSFILKLIDALGTNITCNWNYIPTTSIMTPCPNISSPLEQTKPQNITFNFTNPAGKIVSVSMDLDLISSPEYNGIYHEIDYPNETYSSTAPYNVLDATGAIVACPFFLNPNSATAKYNLLTELLISNGSFTNANSFINYGNGGNGKFKNFECVEDDFTSSNQYKINFTSNYLKSSYYFDQFDSQVLDSFCFYKFKGTITGLDATPPQFDCITPYEMKTAYESYVNDVVIPYQIKGDGHPYYETSIRSFFNYKFRKMNTSHKYLEFIEGCNLSHEFPIEKYYSYFRASGTTSQMNTLIDYIKNYVTPDIPEILSPYKPGEPSIYLTDIPYFQYEEDATPGTDHLYVDMRNIFKNYIHNLRPFIQDLKGFLGTSSVSNYTFNKLNSEISGMPARSVDFFISDENSSVLSSSSAAILSSYGAVISDANMRQSATSSYLFKHYHINFGTTIDHKEIAKRVDVIRSILSDFPDSYINFSTHQSYLNEDNHHTDKQAYLNWAYHFPNLSTSTNNHDGIIDELKKTSLIGNNAVYGTGTYPSTGPSANDYYNSQDYVSYINPDNKKLSFFSEIDDQVSGTLFLAQAPTTYYGFNFLKTILEHSKQSHSLTSAVNPNSIFYPNSVYTSPIILSNLGSYSETGANLFNLPAGHDYTIKFRKLADGIHWFKVKEIMPSSANVAPRYFNVYLKLPEFVTAAELEKFVIVNPATDIKRLVNSKDVRRFIISFTRPAAGGIPEMKIAAYGRTDFNLDNSVPLVFENVMLCEEDEYTDSLESCFDALYSEALTKADVQYYEYIEDKRSSIKADFVYHIKQNIEDVLNVSKKQMKYAMTLYKYDRAGNLIATVPPEGITYTNPTSGAITSGVVSDALIPTADFQRKSVQYGQFSASSPFALYDVPNYLPSYKKVSSYFYNSLNQLTSQTTPDGGETKFYYDPSGKLVFSHNAKQNAISKCSYTLYDDQNRIIETGQINQNTQILALLNSLNNYDYTPSDLLTRCNAYIRTKVRSFSRQEVVRTFYDEPVYAFETVNNGMSKQENLRARVATIANYNLLMGMTSTSVDYPLNNLNIALHYSYDLSGNVKTLTYDMPNLNYLKQRYKRIDYDYDLYSGKVNLVSYNRGFADQFYQRYAYDDDNRITKVETSQDGLLWDKDAEYKYYPHGPLARISLGDLQIQGIDFAYTLQGWLKSINGDAPIALKDIGGDGDGNSAYLTDLHRSTLNYFNGDYEAIDQTQINGTGTLSAIPTMSANRSLYNGNIASSVSIPGYFNSLYTDYWYDQLNRIKKAEYSVPDYTSTSSTFSDIVKKFSSYGGTTLGTGATADDLYKSTYTYDFDGNIKTLQRFGLEHNITYPNSLDITNSLNPAKVFLMDNLNYKYDETVTAGNNKLVNYGESVNHTALTSFDNDVQSHNPVSGVSRFEYDAIGNLTKDASNPNELTEIIWTLYGKVSKINQSAGKYSKFNYEPTGNRLMKAYVRPKQILVPSGAPMNGTAHSNEYYIRDASGNILTVYKQYQEYTYEKPFLQMVEDLALTTDFGTNLGSLLGENAPFIQYLCDGLTIWDPEFMDLKITKPVGYFFRNNINIRDELIKNNEHLITDQIATNSSMLRNAAMTEFDMEFFIPLKLESDSTIRSVYLTQLIDSNSETSITEQMGNIARDLGTEYSGSEMDEFLNIISSAIDDLSLPALEAAFRLIYHDNVNGIFTLKQESYQSALQRLLSLNSYREINYSGIIKGNLKEKFNYELAKEAHVDEVAEYYNTLSDGNDILQIASSPYDRLETVYRENPIDFMQDYTLNPFSSQLIAEALESIEGYTAARFASDYAGISPTASMDVSLSLIPVLQKDKFFLAEHHLYGSSRLGIKKYWPNQYLFNWDVNQSPAWNTIQFENVELATHRPWYSKPYNSLIAANTISPWGNSNTERVVSERIIGQKQYELTNHLGNVMTVLTDKVTESPVDPLVTTAFPKAVKKRASLFAAYDYYPFGMLMPGRFMQDATLQCTPITKSRYLTKYIDNSIIEFVTASPMGQFTATSGTSLSDVIGTTGYLNASRQINGDGGITELFTNFTTQANKEVKITTNVTNLGQQSITVILQQQNTVGEWIELGRQSVYQTSNLTFEASTISSNPLQVLYKGTNGTMRIYGVKYSVKDFFEENYFATICNKDPDFDDDYRFGFNGQEKVNEIAGVGNHNTALFWEYDTRLGRRWNEDPRFKEMPNFSSYSTFNNNPISLVDSKGDFAIWPVWLIAEEALTGLFVAGAILTTASAIHWTMENVYSSPSTPSYAMHDETAVYFPSPSALPKFDIDKAKASGQAVLAIISTVIVGEKVLESAPKGFYQVTYISTNGKTTYIGRTSGYGTPQSIVNKRFNNHHKNKDGFIAGVPTFAIPSTEISSKTKDATYLAVRVAEQVQIAAVGTENQRAGIAENKMDSYNEYIMPITNTIQEKDNCVNCTGQ